MQVEASCKHRCLEDLTSTTRFVTWSLHTKSTKALRSMMSRLQLPEGLRIGSTGIADTSGAVLVLGQQRSGQQPCYHHAMLDCSAPSGTEVLPASQ